MNRQDDTRSFAEKWLDESIKGDSSRFSTRWICALVVMILVGSSTGTVGLYIAEPGMFYNFSEAFAVQFLGITVLFIPTMIFCLLTAKLAERLKLIWVMLITSMIAVSPLILQVTIDLHFEPIYFALMAAIILSTSLGAATARGVHLATLARIKRLALMKEIEESGGHGL